jgi:hypothetical protein
MLDEIAKWQARTGSTVLVDGSFQYMPWNKAVSEASVRLDPSTTIRLESHRRLQEPAGCRSPVRRVAQGGIA